MPSLCLSCLIYTLEDKEVENNKYIDIFIIWFSNLIKYGNLQKDDMLYIISDNRTIEFMKNTHNTIFNSLCSLIQFKIRLLHYDSPKTLMEGMMLRYNINPYAQDIYMYCDIDILILRSLHILTDAMVENHIYVCTEGCFKDVYYSCGIPEEIMIHITDNHQGFSSGKFAIYGKEICEILFNQMNSLYNHNPHITTLDQPIFNHCIILLLNNKFLIDTTLLINYVSFNGDKYKHNTTILFDCAGVECGNDTIHYKKMFDISILFNCGYFNLPIFRPAGI